MTSQPSGRDVLAQVREALAPHDYHAECLPVSEDNPFGCEYQPLGVLHRALDGCVLLTAEEANRLRASIRSGMAFALDMEREKNEALALLTPKAMP